MNRVEKLGMKFLVGFLFTIAMFIFTEGSALASTVTQPSYSFIFGSDTKASGSSIKLKTDSALLEVTNGGAWASDTEVQWVSTAPSIVSTTPSVLGKNYVQLKRLRPGYATIRAIITPAGGGGSYTINLEVEVKLEIDYQKTVTKELDLTGTRIIELASVGDKSTVYLKYVDDDVTAVSGAAISADYVIWSSANTGVATVDPKTGEVTAVGSGTTTITATTSTVSTNGDTMDASIKVVVVPKFKLDFDSSDGYNSVSNKNDPAGIVNNVPSNFDLTSNAKLGNNLKWEVYDCTGTTKKKIAEGVSSKMTYYISDISGNVEFSNVKAGTYEIYAFSSSLYNDKTNTLYAYMKIIVPIKLDQVNLVMTVGDTYDIIDNSNITGVGVFVSPPIYTEGNSSIASINMKDYVITASKKGTVTIELTYDSSSGLYSGSDTPVFRINIRVIDGIALSATNISLYTDTTYILEAFVSDRTKTINWSSKNPKVATVEGGTVTAVGPGTTTITASQKIDGVVKKATCTVTVQQSVTTITLDPREVTIAIGGYAKIRATIKPDSLSGIDLKWRSSNSNIVEILDSDAMVATIQGHTGGYAVISAINQDNVVVGYCEVKVQQPVESISLSETSATVSLASKTLQLRATVNPDNALEKTIIWSSTDTTKATVDENGTVTLLKPGTVTIIATSKDNPKATAYCNLNIEIPVSSVALDETKKTMYIGESARLTYVILPTNASKNAVTWTSTDNSVVTVDATGKVTAKGVGTSLILLRTVEGGFTVYCTITVKSVATGIKFDKTDLELKTGESYTIKTTLTPKDSTENYLSWESSDTKVAVVDDDGKVTAKGAGSAIIMARTEAGAVAYCKVKVTQAVEGLILNFSEKTTFIGQEFKIKVSITPSNASKLDVTWKSSNTKIATVSEDGVVTGVSGGVAIITCTTVDGGFTEACVVTVRESVTTIALNYETYNLGVNKTVKLIATVTADTATNKNVLWTSSNEEVATVSQSGKVTGVSLGYATITATALDGSEVEASCEVRVVRPVTSLTLNKPSMTMYIGDNKTLKATITPSNATFKKAKWYSSDTSVAIVDEDGVVTAIKEGSVMITAEALDNSGKKASCYVWVYARVPSTGITLQDKKVVMVAGEEKRVELVLIPSVSTDSVTWSTDNAAVAKVDKNGKITAKSTGTAYVTVMTDSGKTASVEVVVIGLNMTKLVTEEYTNYKQVLEVEGATGKVTWKIDNPMIAVVYSDGTVSTRGVGTATITASVNGRKLSCKLIVKKMP